MRSCAAKNDAGPYGAGHQGPSRSLHSFSVSRNRVSESGVQIHRTWYRVPTVVVHPPLRTGVDQMRQISQRLIVPRRRESQIPNGLPYRRGRFVAHGRQEAHKELAPVVLRPPRLEGVAVAKEVKLVELIPLRPAGCSVYA